MATQRDSGARARRDTDVAKVVDFGRVKDLDAEVGLTREGRLAGTPHSLAPEAITSPGQVTAKIDLYPLGCVGYFLLTGERVFEGRSVIEVCRHHLETAPVLARRRRPAPEREEPLVAVTAAAV